MLTNEERDQFKGVLEKARTIKVNNVEYVPARAVEIMLDYLTDKTDNTVRFEP